MMSNTVPYGEYIHGLDISSQFCPPSVVLKIMPWVPAAYPVSVSVKVVVRTPFVRPISELIQLSP
jgi:hypothetical protein